MLKRQLENTILHHQLLGPHDRVVVGVSAGPDSVALLCLLKDITLPISPLAVYIDHGLRHEESVLEAQLVKKLAETLQIPYKVIKLDVTRYKQTHQISLEEAARILRYQALEKCRQEFGAAAIAVAHTADDQAEEVLIRLIRGTGVKGLSGMSYRNGMIIRPLLYLRKNELLAFLEKSDISYCIDSTNLDTAILRNRIRLELLPYLEDNFNPAIRTNLLQTAAILEKEEELLSSLTDQYFAKTVRVIPGVSSEDDKRIFLKGQPFLQCHIAVARRILEMICWQLDVRPTFRQIEQVYGLLKKGRNNAELHLPKGLGVLKTNGNLEFARPGGKKRFRGNRFSSPIEALNIDAAGRFQVDGMVLKLSYVSEKPEIIENNDLILDGSKVVFPLTLRAFTPGERFRPSGMQGRKKISRFLSDLKIPKQTRYLHPVLLCKDNIVAVVGLRIDQRFAADDKSTSFLIISWAPATVSGKNLCPGVHKK